MPELESKSKIPNIPLRLRGLLIKAPSTNESNHVQHLQSREEHVSFEFLFRSPHFIHRFILFVEYLWPLQPKTSQWI